MSKYFYSITDYCVMAHDPSSGKEVWRRYLRTYLRDTKQVPMITIQVSTESILAIWKGESVAIDPDNGKVKWHKRAMFQSSIPIFTRELN